MTTRTTRPVPANEPVIIKPVVNLSLWQRIIKWLRLQGNRIVFAALWLASVKVAYEVGQWVQ